MLFLAGAAGILALLVWGASALSTDRDSAINLGLFETLATVQAAERTLADAGIPCRIVKHGLGWAGRAWTFGGPSSGGGHYHLRVLRESADRAERILQMAGHASQREGGRA